MAMMDEAFQGGCCVYLGEVNGELHCRPHITADKHSGNLFYWFIGRLTGVTGEARICLHWPETSESVKNHVYGGNHNFALVLDRDLFTSTDRKTWERIEGVELAGQEARFTVTTDGRPLYISVGVPFLQSDLQALHEEAIASPFVRVTEVARTPHGRPVRVYAIGTGSKDCLYMQGMQHASEWAGARVISAMMRYLLSEEGEPYRERYTWHFCPIVNMDGSIGGLLENHPKNMNRDWVDFQMPETRGVRNYLTTLVNTGHRILYGGDLHMGWSRRDNSGACLTVYLPDYADARTVQCNEDFADTVFANTDYTDRKWYMGQDAEQVRLSFKGWLYTRFGAPAQTMEFSRHLYYIRATDEWVPTAQCYEEAMGPGLVRVMGAFPWDAYRA